VPKLKINGAILVYAYRKGTGRNAQGAPKTTDGF